MYTLRFVVGAACLAMGSLAIIGNWSLAVNCYLYRKSGSLIPVVGGIFAALGILIIPVAGHLRWWWVPLIVDLGCVPILASTAVFLVREYWKTRR